jgi:hypothetical protein
MRHLEPNLFRLERRFVLRLEDEKKEVVLKSELVGYGKEFAYGMDKTFIASFQNLILRIAVGSDVFTMNVFLDNRYPNSGRVLSVKDLGNFGPSFNSAELWWDQFAAVFKREDSRTSCIKLQWEVLDAKDEDCLWSSYLRSDYSWNTPSFREGCERNMKTLITIWRDFYAGTKRLSQLLKNANLSIQVEAEHVSVLGGFLIEHEDVDEETVRGTFIDTTLKEWSGKRIESGTFEFGGSRLISFSTVWE